MEHEREGGGNKEQREGGREGESKGERERGREGRERNTST